MRKISKKWRKKAGNIYCPYCKPSKVDAIWRASGHVNLAHDVACQKHKNLIKEEPESQLTEADYQTWERL